MIGDWFAITPALLATLLLLFLPGAAALLGIGFRRLPLLAFAPVLSTAMIAVAALILGFVHASWNALSLAIVILVMVGLAWGLGALLGSPGSDPLKRPAAPWLLPTGLLAGAILGGWRLIAYIADPAGISQTNDAVFHMNAVRYIIETADASSLHVSGVIGANGFYPAAWHAVVSAVVAMTGAEVAVAANALTLVIGAVIWPLGLTWFAREAIGSTRVAAITAALSPALQTFPLLMIQWGVLFPNALSVALVPAAIAVVLWIRGQWSAGRVVGSSIRAVLLVGVAVAALALAQPAALPVWGAAILVWFTDLMLRVHRGSRLLWRLLLVIVCWFALVAMWLVLSGGTGGAHWPRFRTKAEAMLEVLFNGQVRIPFAWGISILMIIGLIVALVTPAWRWLVALWVGASGLYLLVAVVAHPWVRNVVLGPWYADPNRLAAFAPIIVIPLAALGLDRLVRSGARLVGRRDDRETDPAVLVLAVVCTLLIVLMRPAQMPQFLDGSLDRESRYLTTRTSYLSTDERSLLEGLDEHVRSDERVIANPSTGAAFGYMFSGVDVYPRTWSPPDDAAWMIVSEELRDVAEDPGVCAALDDLGDPAYVLDFGPGEALPGRWIMPGMTDFAGRPGFELVEKRGDVSLWQITACAD